MSEPAPASTRGNYYCAVVALITGTYFFVLGAGLLPIPGGPKNMHGPQWLVMCVGLAFFLAGVAIVIQTVGHANQATGDLPAEAPRWMRAMQHLLGLTICVCLGAVASWVAFGPGERQFSGSFLFFDRETNAIIGRTAFGVGAVIIWLCIAAVVASGIRKFFDDTGKPRAG
ncbi:MAG: hypothetical protein WBG10_16760 [Pseudolabrys sp.]